MAADSAKLLPLLEAALSATFPTTTELVDYLLLKKSFVPTHEAVGAVLITSEPCRARLCALLRGVADVLTRRPSTSHLFEQLPQSTEKTLVFRLKP